jgi:ABC-type amino acid transport substrate-binding protein
VKKGPSKAIIAITVFFIALVFLPACSRARQGLNRVLETGVLRVGMDASFPPFEYVDGGGDLVGFDVDLARELADHLAAQASQGGQFQEVEVQFVANLPYDGLYDALTADRVDVVISALYVDPTRMANFAYSTAYFNAGQVLIMREGGDGIEGMEDLAGLRLAVEFGSEGDVEARAWSRRLVGLEVVPCQSAAEVLVRVAAGEADAGLVDHVSALAGSGEVQVVGHPVTDEPYAVAVLRESRALLRAADEALEELEANGTLAELQQRWFAGP